MTDNYAEINEPPIKTDITRIADALERIAVTYELIDARNEKWDEAGVYDGGMAEKIKELKARVAELEAEDQ